MPLTNDPGLIDIAMYDSEEAAWTSPESPIGQMKLHQVPAPGDTIVYDRVGYRVKYNSKWHVLKESYGSQPYIVHLFVERIEY